MNVKAKGTRNEHRSMAILGAADLVSMFSIRPDSRERVIEGVLARGGLPKEMCIDKTSMRRVTVGLYEEWPVPSELEVRLEGSTRKG
jgi:hypothetical protein